MTCPDAATRQKRPPRPRPYRAPLAKEGYTRIPNWVYTDPAIFQKEMDVFFGGKTWNYVGLECEVPETGCFKRNWIGNRPVIMVRGENGDIHVLENRCAHRGAQICWQNTGKVADFTCPYHQWNYDLEGNLQGVPFRRGALGKGGMPRDFDPKQNGIRKLRSQSRRLGLGHLRRGRAQLRGLLRSGSAGRDRSHAAGQAAQAAGLQPPADPQQLEDVPGEPEGPVPRNPAAHLLHHLRPVARGFQVRVHSDRRRRAA